jgi:SPOR domain
MLASLTEKGYSPYIFETVTTKNKTLYCVRVQNFLDLKAAFNAEAEYRKKESEPAIVTFYNMLDAVPHEIGKN